MINVKYVSANGTEIELLGDNLRVTDGSVHQYSFTPVTVASIVGDSLRYFQQKPITYEITITLRGTLEERYARLDWIHDILERDVTQKTAGRLVFGDYYIKTYATATEVGVNANLNSRTDVVISFYCPYPRWIKEHAFDFGKASSSEQVGGFNYAPDGRVSGQMLKEAVFTNAVTSYSTGWHIGYGDFDLNLIYFEIDPTKSYKFIASARYVYTREAPWKEMSIGAPATAQSGSTLTIPSDANYIVVEDSGCNYVIEETTTPTDGLDYAYDFGSNENNHRQYSLEGYAPSNFMMRIYGACINPSVTINGHVYMVNTSIAEGEYIEIDSSNKTVVLHSGNTTVNLYDLRYKKSDIFEAIDPTTMDVNWSGGFSFKLILKLERSVPRWTA